MKASKHARERSRDRHGREHSVGTACRRAMKDGLVLPFPDRPGIVLVIALDGRRWVVDTIADEVLTALPRLPEHFHVRKKESHGE